MSLYAIYKKLAFLFDPETMHNLAIRVAKNLPNLSNVYSLELDNKFQTNSEHLKWKFPIGLGAGLDKNAEALEFFNQLGFGALEIGTVTPKAQIGNPTPRIWRLKKNESLRNAMGFPNIGMNEFAKNIQNNKVFCLGINIGKNKDSKDPLSDYIELAKKFDQKCHYLAVNISSPNTKNLRSLQNENFLRDLSSEIQGNNVQVPIFIKISPDMDDATTIKMTEDCIKHNFQGIICTNTTLDHNYAKGGISGKDLKVLSTHKRQLVCSVTRSVSNFDTIGIGGVSHIDDLYRFWKDGGDMMQIYTSFIYQGPGILKEFKEAIENDLKKYQLKNVMELKEFTKISN